jgi:hypothetical protein
MPTDIKLLFLASSRFERGEAIRGGALVTDSSTKPLEFRCTDPIRPSPLQKTLYGGMLEEHVLLELIAKPLLRTLAAKPQIVLVREPLLLQLRPSVELPVFCVATDKDFSAHQTDAGTQSPMLLNSDTGRFEPVVISAHADYGEERDAQRAALAEVFRHHNLLEPFERIATALQQVHTKTEE